MNQCPDGEYIESEFHSRESVLCSLDGDWYSEIHQDNLKPHAANELAKHIHQSIRSKRRSAIKSDPNQQTQPYLFGHLVGGDCFHILFQHRASLLIRRGWADEFCFKSTASLPLPFTLQPTEPGSPRVLKALLDLTHWSHLREPIRHTNCWGQCALTSWALQSQLLALQSCISPLDSLSGGFRAGQSKHTC